MATDISKPALAPEQAKPARLSRRDEFAVRFGAAILARGGMGGRKADAVAREVVTFTDAFLAELDRPKGA